MSSQIPSSLPHRHFVLVAGEASGDQLGARLIEQLHKLYPNAHFSGIGGPQMIAAGLNTWFPSEKLSVMGLVEIIAHLPELLRIRREVIRRTKLLQPDCFIGIDAPDFNLKIENRLKRAGIRTVHYVSPSIWAWREKRAEKIGKSADLVLCLFPMEPAIYARYGVKATFVGHPLADEFPLKADKVLARKKLNLPPDSIILALLPGSRISEIQKLGSIFIQAVSLFKDKISSLKIIAPMANKSCLNAFSDLVSDKAITLIEGESHLVLQAADVALLASGTAALEALFAKTPMVVGYRINGFSYRLIRWFKLMKTPYYSLPNILTGQKLVPEFIQQECTPENLASALLSLLENRQAHKELILEFERIHIQLQQNASHSAAYAIYQLLK